MTSSPDTGQAGGGTPPWPAPKHERRTAPAEVEPPGAKDQVIARLYAQNDAALLLLVFGAALAVAVLVAKSA